MAGYTMLLRISCIIALLVFPVYLHGQTAAEQDSAKIYKSIESYAKKRGFTKFVYKLFFRPVVAASTPVNTKKKISKVIYYKKFENKVIRNIRIVTMDPFGYSMADTTISPKGFIRKTGNALHHKTFGMTLRQLLLFREGDRFDSLLVRDSERLIRSQKYIRDVAFYPSVVPNTDSVDIYIRELDGWSIIVEGSGTTSKLAFEFTERNFMGLGHRLEYDYRLHYADGNNTHEINYQIPNFKHTYISTNIRYFIGDQHNIARSVNIERPFYSAYAKWAGGAYVGQQISEGPVIVDSVPVMQNFKSVQQDYWAGKAWQLFRGSGEDDRSTNLIFSLRYAKLHYDERPLPEIDTLNNFADNSFYLAGLGISMRKYVQDRYLFKYNVTEDVPVGKVYGIVAGYQVKANTTNWYLGFRLAWGNYYRWGYFSSHLEYGTFTDINTFDQGVFSASLNYFTNLTEFGRWRFRQFIKPELTIGIKRLPSERISLNDDNGIRGFNSETLTGTQKFLLTFQSQTYAPWEILGFRFGPYFVCAFGLLGEEDTGFKRSKLYSQFGIGMLIKNDYLVLNTFQISIAYYPVIPGNGSDIFKFNPVKTTDFGLKDFDFSKPAMSVYQ